jgi:hypothetical protein
MEVRLSALRVGSPLSAGRFLVLTGWLDPTVIVRMEGLDKFKNPVTPSGIEPANFHLVTLIFFSLYSEGWRHCGH